MKEKWWAHKGSNLGPLPCEGNALPLSYAPGMSCTEDDGADGPGGADVSGIYGVGEGGVNPDAGDGAGFVDRRSTNRQVSFPGRDAARRRRCAASRAAWCVADPGPRFAEATGIPDLRSSMRCCASVRSFASL